MLYPITVSIIKNLSFLLRNCIFLNIHQGKQVHAQILVHGILPHVVLETDLLLMYSKCNDLETVNHVFDEMPHRNVHTWNILICGYVRNSHWNQALGAFNGFLKVGLRPDHFTFPSVFKACAGIGSLIQGQMLHSLVISSGFLDHVVVGSSILHMYAKCGCLDDAHQVFDEMSNRDVVSWNSVISGFVRAGFCAEALSLFFEMQRQGFKMDEKTIPSVLSACEREGDLLKGKEIHGYLAKSPFIYCDAAIGNSLIDLYGKCGCLDYANRVFVKMPDWNLITWTTLISCYGIHGRGDDSISLFEKMQIQGFRPNSVTFTAILASCSHSGLLDQGQKIFDAMSQDYNVNPSLEHYACMVDLLGRYGQLEEAFDFIKKMPIEPQASVWGALLSGCRMHKNVHLGEIAANRLFELEPGNSSNYVVLAGMYEVVGRLDDVSKIRTRMRELRLVKTPGCSWINIKGKVHRFFQGGGCNSQKKEICATLDGLSQVLRMMLEGSYDAKNLILHKMGMATIWSL